MTNKTKLQDKVKHDEDSMVPWMPTSELLKKFDPDNPKIHEVEGDLTKIRESLLEFGWASTLTLQKGGTLISGHGRCLASDMLRQYTQEQFEQAWEEWLATNPGRQSVAKSHALRFQSAYWERCPVTVVDVDNTTGKSLLLRLNNQSYDGKLDQSKVAALLARLPERQQDRAGFDKKVAQSFIDAYLEKAPPPKPEVDFEPKQYFERPDATVYNAQGEVVEKEAIATMDEIPSDWVIEVDGKSYTTGQLEEAQAEGDFDPEIALDDLDLDNLDKSEFRGASVDRDVAETRIVLLVSKRDLEEYKQMINAIAQWIGVPMEGGAKIWRPKAVMAVLRSAFASAIKSGVVTEISSEVEEEEEDKEE